MKKWLAVCLALLLVAASTTFNKPVFRQVQIEFVTEQDHPFVLPPITFELKDVIDVLTEYNIDHTHMEMFCRQFYGTTRFDTKTIDICNIYDQADRRLTVLHELLHVRYHQYQINTGGPYEVLIDEQAHALFEKLYGIPVPADKTPAPTVP